MSMEIPDSTTESIIKPDATYESDREIIVEEIINLENKMEPVRKQLEVILQTGENMKGMVAELQNKLRAYQDMLFELQTALVQLRQISGPRRKALEPASIN